MTYFLKIAAAILIGLLVIGWLIVNVSPLSIFFPKYDTYDWRQKTTLVVETPEGTLTGASVVQIRALLYRGENIGGLEVSYGVTGEAAALEVAPGKWLYATIGEPAEAFYVVDRNTDRTRFSTTVRRAWLPQIRKQDGVISLMSVMTPDLVTFDDINNPKTARAVEPQDLETAFGPGFELKDITLEIVDEPVTEGQLGPLGEWIADYQDRQLDGSWPKSPRGDLPNATSLNSRDFKRWAK